MANVLPASSLGIIKEYIDKGDNTLMADIIEQQYAIDNLLAMTEGRTHNTYKETTSNGTKTLTSSAEVAPYAEVNKVLGHSETSKNLFCPSSTPSLEAIVALDKAIPVGTHTVSAKDFGDNTLQMNWYDKDRNLIDSDYIHSNRANGRIYKTLTETVEVAFFAIATSSVSDLSSLKIQIEIGSSATSYEAHYEGIHSLKGAITVKSTGTNITDTITLKDSINLQGVGTARDEYVPETGKIQRKFIQKLMTSLNWNGSNGNYSTMASDMSNRSGLNLTPMICEIYPIGTSSYDCTIRNDSRYIAVTDSSCPSLESFMSKIAGKYIGYEKAEYTEETEEACNRFLKVEKGGTITVSSNESYGDAEITYQTQISST